jgi:hypothetical protein
MKRLFVALWMVTLVLGCSSTVGNEYYSYEYLKNDYEQAAVVAHVDVQNVSVVDSIGDGAVGYVRYLISAHIIEPFKGDIKGGKGISYYSVAEKGYDPENYRGKRIVFLNSLFDKQKAAWVLSELENSFRPASQAIITKMRNIKRGTERE